MNKQAEAEWTACAAHHQIWNHKWKDVVRCGTCGSRIFLTNRTMNDDGREIKESIVDYLAFAENIPMWIEVKGQVNNKRLEYAETKPHQRQFLNSWTARGVFCFIFALIGEGQPDWKPPRQRHAVLVPWKNWLLEERKHQAETGLLSFNHSYILANWTPYLLKWGKHRNLKGGWIIPVEHPIIEMIPKILELPPLFQDVSVEELLS